MGGLISVNCPALNGAILTNAPRDTERFDEEGRLCELCATADATLFLDQVSELSRATQTRVLHAILHAGNAEANDSAGQLRTGARLVSATNRPLAPMLLGGEFRRELYDRLSVLTLGVPPLRERRGDMRCSPRACCAWRRRNCASRPGAQGARQLFVSRQCA